MSARLAFPAGDDRAAMVRHLAGLQEAGRNVVLVTTTHPARHLLPSFQEGGLDLDRFAVVDAVTPPEQGDHPEELLCAYVGSPIMLELITLRTERLARMLGDAHVVVCCLNTLEIYNEREAVDQFIHFMTARLSAFGVDVDFVLRPGGDTAATAKRVSPFMEGRVA